MNESYAEHWVGEFDGQRRIVHVEIEVRPSGLECVTIEARHYRQMLEAVGYQKAEEIERD